MLIIEDISEQEQFNAKHKQIDIHFEKDSDVLTLEANKNPGNIFLPLYSTKQGSENNLGLGLSVSYGIIQKYNGTIAVKNIDNTGCQFVITLPQST